VPQEIEIPEGEPPSWLWQGKLPEERHPFMKLTHRHQGRVIQVEMHTSLRNPHNGAVANGEQRQ
jgi:hypothetical protein